MADKATLEIKIQDGGGSASNYQGPIQQGGYAQPANRINSGIPSVDSLVDSANALGNSLPGRIRRTVDDLLEVMSSQAEQLKNDPTLRQVMIERAKELQETINKTTQQEYEKRYRQIFGEMSPQEKKRNQAEQAEMQQANNERWTKIGNQIRAGIGLLSPSAGGALGNFAKMELAGAAGPAGIALAGLQVLNSAAIQAGRELAKLASAATRLNADEFVSATNDAIKQIPLFGEALGLLGDTIISLDRGVMDTANRFSGLSPELAYAQAQVEMQRTFREIQQAQTLGPQLADYVLRRDEINARIEQILLDMQIKLLPVLERYLPYLERLAETGAATLDAATDSRPFFERVGRFFATGDFGEISSYFGILAVNVAQIAQNTTPQATGGATLYDQLFGDRPAPQLAPQIPAQNVPPNIPGANIP